MIPLETVESPDVDCFGLENGDPIFDSEEICWDTFDLDAMRYWEGCEEYDACAPAMLVWTDYNNVADDDIPF